LGSTRLNSGRWVAQTHRLEAVIHRPMLCRTECAVQANGLVPRESYTWWDHHALISIVVTTIGNALMRLEHMSHAEIFSIANPIMDNLMDASTAIDHERHIRDFTDRMKSIVTKERQTRPPAR
jgi:hypothetical protein